MVTIFCTQFLGGIFGKRIGALCRRRRQRTKPGLGCPRHAPCSDAQSGYFFPVGIAIATLRRRGAADDARILIFSDVLGFGARGRRNAGGLASIRSCGRVCSRLLRTCQSKLMSIRRSSGRSCRQQTMRIGPLVWARDWDRKLRT